MKIFLLSCLLFVCLATCPAFGQVKEDYPVDPASQPQPNVPRGEVLKYTFSASKIFPGTIRDYWVYVPAQYKPDQPACLYVNQDGIQWQAPTVFDNLVAKKEMPVTIGVFVMHGRVKGSDAALDRFNRSFEYDGLGDHYVRFLLEELLPEVETKRASDGRAIRLSRDGNDHAIGGASSGAIAAFTAAWERPDAFSRVFSAIGTYVGLRGGDRYPTLVRKYEPKPLRIFLQDGTNDLNIYAGDWWMVNQTMERALTFAGYEVKHVWGEGAHNGKHGTAIFPEAMRWLWKDWPQRIAGGPSKNAMLGDILLRDESWRAVGGVSKNISALIVNAKGEVLVRAGADQALKKIVVEESNVAPPVPSSPKPAGDVEAQSAGPDGLIYAANRKGRNIVTVDENNRTKKFADLPDVSALVVAHNGDVYAGINSQTANAGQIWLIKPNGDKVLADKGLTAIGGLALSTDQSLLYANDPRTHWVYSYQINHDGLLKYKQRYYWLHSTDAGDGSGASAMAVDRDGRLYVASDLGIQVCDQAGRVNVILPLPGGRATGLIFGGADFDTLYVASGGQIYRRKMKIKGAPSWALPFKPTPPRL